MTRPNPNHAGSGADGASRLSITLDVTPALRQGGGIGRYTRELTRALLARDRNDYTLFVADRVADRAAAWAALGITPAPPDQRGSPVLRTTPLPARWMTLLWHRLHLPLPVELWTGTGDVVHATDFLAPPTRAARTVITVHDLSFLILPERAEPTLARYLAARIPAAVARAAVVLADSRNTRRDLLDVLGADHDKVHVALPGVDAARFAVGTTERQRVRDKLGLRRPFVLGVGTMEPRKDWPTLVAAFEAAQLEGYELVLAGGRGWRTAALETALATTRAPVRRLGFIAEEDLPGLLASARAFAYPSVYEGFGLPPLEAMAAGTPTAVSDVSSLPEVVGEAALRLPPGDVHAWAEALRHLSTEGPLRTRLVAEGPRRAARFTWTACAQAVEATYTAATHPQP